MLSFELPPATSATAITSTSLRFPIGPGKMDSVSLSVFVGDLIIQDVALVVRTHDGHIIQPDTVDSSQRLGINRNSFAYKSYVFAQPFSPSEWTVSISSKSFSGKGLLMVSYHDDVQLWSGLDSHELIVGKKVSLTGALIGDSLSSFRTNATNVLSDEETCSVDVTTPSGSHIKKDMRRRHLDAGHYLSRTHGFDEAFAIDLDLDTAGTYTVEVSAQGPMATRSSWHSFKVVKPLVSLTGKATAHTEETPSHCTTPVTSEAQVTQLALLAHGYANSTTAVGPGVSNSLRIDLGVDGVAPGRYRVYAELYAGSGSASDGDSTLMPVCWVGGMVEVAAGVGSVGLRVDERWFHRIHRMGDEEDAEQHGAFNGNIQRMELRRVRLEDADNFIPVAQAAEVKVAVGPLVQQRMAAVMRIAAGAGGAVALRLVAPSRVMLEGCPPAELLAKAKRFAAANTTAAVTGALRGKGGAGAGGGGGGGGEGTVVGAVASGALSLVHGYCSDSVWPAGDFSNAIVFQDFGQSRTHDYFAQLIGQSLDRAGSVAVVSHSQGGMASLQLKSAYFSNNTILHYTTLHSYTHTLIHHTPYTRTLIHSYTHTLIHPSLLTPLSHHLPPPTSPPLLHRCVLFKP
jgi:hypothetical protein